MGEWKRQLRQKKHWQVLHHCTLVTQNPRLLLHCECNTMHANDLSITDIAIEPEQKQKWQANINEGSQCAICLERPVDAVLTQCAQRRLHSADVSSSEDDENGSNDRGSDENGSSERRDDGGALISSSASTFIAQRLSVN